MFVEQDTPKENLKAALEAELLPFFEAKGFERGLPSGENERWKNDLPLGQLRRFRSDGWMDTVEIDFAKYDTPEFRINSASIPKEGSFIHRLNLHVPQEDCMSHNADRIYTAYQSKARLGYFRLPLLKRKTYANYRELARNVQPIVCELLKCLRDSVEGTHVAIFEPEKR